MKKSIKNQKSKIFNCLSCVAILFFACTFTFTGCKKETETPEWLNAVVTDFSNGKFAPELEDVLPGAAFGSSDAKSLSRSALWGSVFPEPAHRIIRLASDQLPVVKSSQIRWIYEIDWVLDNFDAMRNLMEPQKSNIMRQFENSGVEKQNVWHNDFKYEETPGRDRIIYVNKKSERVKLSMYADGANEIYSSTTTDNKIDVDMYSYLKGDKFMYLSKQNEGTREEYRYLEFEQTNGIKKGTMIRFFFDPDSDPYFMDNGHKLFAYSFEGNDDYMELHRHHATHLTGSAATSSCQISVLEDGFEVKYGKSNIGSEDIRLSAGMLNIVEIYLEDELPTNRGSVHVHSLLLDSGEKIILDPFDIDTYKNPAYNFMIVNYIWDKQNNVAITNEYSSGLFFYSRVGFKGSLNDILTAHYPGLKAKNNLDYERYRPVADDLLTGISPEVNTLKTSKLNIEKWDDFKKTINVYIESKNTGF